MDLISLNAEWACSPSYRKIIFTALKVLRETRKVLIIGVLTLTLQASIDQQPMMNLDSSRATRKTSPLLKKTEAVKLVTGVWDSGGGGIGRRTVGSN